MAGKCVFWFWQENTFFGFGRKSFLQFYRKTCFYDFSEKHVFTVLARKYAITVLARKYAFADLARKRVLWVWRKNVFCGFCEKTHFYYFGGKTSSGRKTRFCGFGGKLCLVGFGGKMCFVVLVENSFFLWFYRFSWVIKWY